MPDKTVHSPAVNDNGRPPAGHHRQAPLKSFLLARWRGEVPLGVAFWWDMWCVGTTINIAAALAGMVLLAADAPTAIAAFIFFAPLPYNLLLLLSVWRSAEKAAGPGSVAARLAAAAWVILATVI